jgi:hypothetical protein
LDPNIDRANGRKVKWAEDEDIKLKDAVQSYGGENGGAIAALVPGGTQKQCHCRWKDALDLSIDRANGRTGQLVEDEDSKLKNAVQTHDGKGWAAIFALVPGRARSQCRDRWKNALNPSIGRASGRIGRWTAVEDSKLQNAAQMHGGKNWDVVATLVSVERKNSVAIERNPWRIT